MPAADIVVLTMDDHEPLRDDLARAGATACVRKPEINAQLLPLLRGYLAAEYEMIQAISVAPDDART